jgi:anti-sigma regulatory factor (Ser/Thr protein kinase)
VPADAQVSRSFPGLPQSPGRARAFVAETLADWGLTELSDSAALVVTELAVNAVRHAQTDFTVSLACNDRRLRITVGDADSARPRRRSTDLRTDSGRGLLIVDALSTGWGSTPMGAGKLVWADLDSPT